MTLRTRHDGGGTERPTEWGIDSEHAPLRDVLLGRVDSFRWMQDENAAFSALVRETRRQGLRFDRDLAVRQHGEMVDAYRHAGVNVHWLEPHDQLPYGVYARDSSVMTPFGAVICQLANPRRRGEYATALRFHLQNGVPIYELVTSGNFEGGDFCMIDPESALIGYTGARTEECAAREVGAWLTAEGIDVVYVPIDEFYVHIDLMICMVAPRLALISPDVLPDHVLRWLIGKGIETISVPFRETMSLGCNAMALGNDRVLSTAQAESVNVALRALGFTVYDPDMSMFIRAGGGVHCLAQPLRRDPA